MSNYEITKNEYSVDIRRISDGMACGFMVQNVWNDLGVTYQTGDTLPDGKKVGDVKVAGLGWQQQDYNWDTELTRVFGEVDATVKSELEAHATSDLKTKYFNMEKAQ